KWGGPEADGTVSGIIGMVHRHEAHVAQCEITITEQRETVVDFTTPYYQDATVLVSRAPELKSRVWAIFAAFPPLVWLLIGISTLLIGPIAALISWLMQAYRKDDPP
ncbi:unnamed protein product, partial [Meganyctiphanes norvegica]